MINTGNLDPKMQQKEAPRRKRESFKGSVKTIGKVGFAIRKRGGMDSDGNGRSRFRRS